MNRKLTAKPDLTETSKAKLVLKLISKTERMQFWVVKISALVVEFCSFGCVIEIFRY